ncbi:MAG: hypothetical protein KDK29_20635, partial [Sedimentitalea sp.]|nr:hypothetical protein [Sedimentitalea sp.]
LSTPRLELISLDGALQAISLTGAAPGLPSYTVTDQGDLVAGAYLKAPGLGAQIATMASAQIGNAQYLWVSETGRSGIDCYRVTGASSLRAEPAHSAAGA